MRPLWRRRAALAQDREAGLTLVELLVAAAMGVVLIGVAGSLLLAPLRQQPKLEAKSADIQTARWVLERMTREIRNGISVDAATPSSVSFEAYVRQATCGGSETLAAEAPSIKCELTYSCAAEVCTRTEAEPGAFTGTTTTIFTGLSNSGSVFSYLPEKSTEPTYIKLTLALPNQSGSGALTASDGASLRNATLEN